MLQLQTPLSRPRPRARGLARLPQRSEAGHWDSWSDVSDVVMSPRLPAVRRAALEICWKRGQAYSAMSLGLDLWYFLGRFQAMDRDDDREVTWEEFFASGLISHGCILTMADKTW